MSRNIIVLKYGGSSVANKDKILAIAQNIKQLYLKKNKIVIVISAMGKFTNELVVLAHEISSTPLEREVDVILSTGERISMAMLSIALNDINIPAISFTGSQAGVITNCSHTKAKIEKIKPYRVLEELDKCKVAIIAGFQGVSLDKNITTLGRGGSDLSALAIAASLKAASCIINTDVDGIYPVNPSIIPNARPYKNMSYQLAYYMAKTGAKVMHDRACALALSYKIPYYVRSSFNSKGGTQVNDFNEDIKEKPSIAAINFVENCSALCPSDKNFKSTLKKLAEKDINIHAVFYIKDKNYIFIIPEEYMKCATLFNFLPNKYILYSILSSGLNDFSGSYVALLDIIDSLKEKPLFFEATSFLNTICYEQTFDTQEFLKKLVEKIQTKFPILNLNT